MINKTHVWPRIIPQLTCKLGHNREKIKDFLIFDSCWKNEVSNFCLRQFEKVVPFYKLYGADVVNDPMRLAKDSSFDFFALEHFS